MTMTIFCSECGKELTSESKFCHYCGIRVQIAENTSEPQEDATKTALDTTTLFGKFAQIYDSEGEEEKEYLRLTTNEVWELINRIALSKFEDFLQENRQSLNKEPYRVIEQIKSAYSASATGGYYLWLAEALLANPSLSTPKPFDMEKLAHNWTEVVKNSNIEEIVSNDMANAMTLFRDHLMKGIMNSSETIKSQPHSLIEQLETDLFIAMYWGYMTGIAESKNRKTK